jgi:radical SAM superfamily enzyme YgiQ (UPF0313 family)
VGGFTREPDDVHARTIKGMAFLFRILDGVHFRVRRILLPFWLLQHHVIPRANNAISLYNHRTMPVKHPRLEGTLNSGVNKDSVFSHMHHGGTLLP